MLHAAEIKVRRRRQRGVIRRLVADESKIETGKAAFRGDDPITTLAAIVATNPPPALKLVPDLPRPVGHIIDICLRKKPADRWQNVGDVKLLLDSALEDLAAPADSSHSMRLRFAIFKAPVANAIS